MSPISSRLIALTAVMLALAGCQTAEEIRASDENRCVSYGFRPRTDAFAACLQRIDLDRRAELRAASREALFMSQPVYVVRTYRR